MLPMSGWQIHSIETSYHWTGVLEDCVVSTVVGPLSSVSLAHMRCHQTQRRSIVCRSRGVGVAAPIALTSSSVSFSVSPISSHRFRGNVWICDDWYSRVQRALKLNAFHRLAQIGCLPNRRES